VEVTNHQSRAPSQGLPSLQKFTNLSQSADAGERGIQQTPSSQSLDVPASCTVATQYFILVSNFLKPNKLLTIFYEVNKQMAGILFIALDLF